MTEPTIPAAVTVRGYREADREALRALFARAGEGTPTEVLWGHPASEAAVYLDPYVEDLPGSLLVADEGGVLVGYLTGCPDGALLPGEGARWERAARTHRLHARARPAAFLARAVLDQARGAVRGRPQAGEFADPRWPAHLHVTLAPAARGRGIGSALLVRWLDLLRAAGSPGCHLQTLVENTGAVRFFARHGFLAHGPTPPVPGLRDARGRRVHQLTMVRTL